MSRSVWRTRGGQVELAHRVVERPKQVEGGAADLDGEGGGVWTTGIRSALLSRLSTEAKARGGPCIGEAPALCLFAAWTLQMNVEVVEEEERVEIMRRVGG